MVLTENERALLGNPTPEDIEDIDLDHQRLDYSPSEQSKIGKWTLVALILNRTIGSGIFLTPHKILAGTGCVGGALLLWVVGAFVSLCGLYVWLECGLSMPQRTVRGESEPRGVPRSGGEKNFVCILRASPLVTQLTSSPAGVYVPQCPCKATSYPHDVFFQYHVHPYV